MAVLAPIPTARTRMVTTVTPKLRRNPRRAKRTSWNKRAIAAVTCEEWATWEPSISDRKGASSGRFWDSQSRNRTEPRMYSMAWRGWTPRDSRGRRYTSKCEACSRHFFVHRHCFRGQAYCGLVCRRQRRLDNVRRAADAIGARRRAGRTNRDAERDRRLRRRVADHRSPNGRRPALVGRAASLAPSVSFRWSYDSADQGCQSGVWTGTAFELVPVSPPPTYRLCSLGAEVTDA